MFAGDLVDDVFADRMRNTVNARRPYDIEPVTAQHSVWELLQAARRRDADWLARNSKGGEQ